MRARLLAWLIAHRWIHRNPWFPFDSDGFVTLSIPYPHHLPMNVLAPGRFYDIEQWREWYKEIGFDIEDIYRTDFLPFNRCTIYMYRNGTNQRRFIDRGEVATVDPITIVYRRPPPTYT